MDAERRENIHVRVGIDEASFVRMRIARDAKLAMPALILPSAQSICAPDACRPRKTTAKSLASRNRLLLLCHLVGGERSVGELAKDIGLAQSNRFSIALPTRASAGS